MKAKKISEKLLLLAILLTLVACFSTRKAASKRTFYSPYSEGSVLVTDEDAEITYYDVEADGYVIYGYTKEPIAGIKVQVTSGRPHHWHLMGPYIENYYYTDSNGYYRIRFVKTINEKETRNNSVGICSLDSPYVYQDVRWGNYKWFGGQGFPQYKLDSAKTTIRIDTAKVYPRDSIIYDFYKGRYLRGEE
jgi:hypothetical protein